MKKIRVLITAGPTREFIDPVRYISNASSGQMGFALAEAANKLGAHVTLIAGHVNLATPHGVKQLDVTTFDEMLRTVKKYFPKSDVIFMSAAVSDFTPLAYSKNKIKYKNTKKPLSLRLKVNSDILKLLGKIKQDHQIIAGFALETKDLEKNALTKLKDKNCDWIIANTASAIGKQSSKLILFSKSGEKIVLPKLPKQESALLILSYVLKNLQSP